MKKTEEHMIYFAHPMKLYATPEELVVLQALHKEYPGYKIVDPRDAHPEGKWVSCKDCMEGIMRRVFFPLIEKAQLFAIWAPLKSCGIRCEFHYAWQLGKPCIYISGFADEVEFEEITLQEYHYIESQTPVEEIR